jgi:hypothetical protein
MFAAMAQPPALNLAMDIDLAEIPSVPYPDVCHSWGGTPAPALLAASLVPSPFSATPLITLSRVRFTFNNPPGKEKEKPRVFFRAYLLDDMTDLKNPKGLPLALTYAKDQPETVYSSTILPTNAKLTFPDIVRFVIDRPLSENAHIIVHFCIIPASGAIRVYKTSIIPFFTEAVPIRTAQSVVHPLIKLDAVDAKKYLPLNAKKLKADSKTTLDMEVGPAFAPHRAFSDLVNKMKVGTSFKLHLEGVPKPLQGDVLIPTVSKYLAILG